MKSLNEIKKSIEKVEKLKKLLLEQKEQIEKEEAESGAVIYEYYDLDQLLKSEKYRIKTALEMFSDSNAEAAEALGISERTLYRKLIKYNL